MVTGFNAIYLKICLLLFLTNILVCYCAPEYWWTPLAQFKITEACVGGAEYPGTEDYLYLRRLLVIRYKYEGEWVTGKGIYRKDGGIFEAYVISNQHQQIIVSDLSKIEVLSSNVNGFKWAKIKSTEKSFPCNAIPGGQNGNVTNYIGRAGYPETRLYQIGMVDGTSKKMTTCQEDYDLWSTYEILVWNSECVGTYKRKGTWRKDEL